MTDESLEELERKMEEANAKFAEACKNRYEFTDKGIIFDMPDFDDPEVLTLFDEWNAACSAYFAAAKHLRHATTHKSPDRE